MTLLSCRNEKNPEQGCRKWTSRKKEGNGHKISRKIWQTKRASLGEEFVFGRSTKRNEISADSIKRNKAISLAPKCSGISRFHNDRHRYIWCLEFFSWQSRTVG
ncbi:hypothetical protein AVEN_252618-1 [Araneus ventricosus]|uniref:Uncharacterized protein n=1 Tax=Araneus ventricosus TaxID=182803 RepID=A0A4Y2ARV2_ARAVE|nr:hypothetical protein AVEN_252618-1 [Araneus ventricosus]